MNISRLVIGCAMAVHRELGNGYLEVVYERALEIELKSKGIRFERQVSLPVQYKGQPIGTFAADMVVAGGLLFNFGQQSLQTKRLVHQYNEDHHI